jgi:serine/threonine-protein kinase
MKFGAQLFQRFISINFLVVALILTLLADAPLPLWWQTLNKSADKLMLNLAVDFIKFPIPQTAVTVIHVPDIEYEAWLADIAGADALIRLIDKADASGAHSRRALNKRSNPVPGRNIAPSDAVPTDEKSSAREAQSLVDDAYINRAASPGNIKGGDPSQLRSPGFSDTDADAKLHLDGSSRDPFESSAPLAIGLIVEEPLNFIQGRAEKLLGAWSQDDATQSLSFHDALLSAVTDREVLMATLRERAVIGIEGRVSAPGRLVVVDPFEFTVINLPQSLTSFIWPLYSPDLTNKAFEKAQFSAPVEHFLLPSVDQIEQPIVVNLGGGEARESFILSFLRMGDLLFDRNLLPTPPLTSWRQGKPLSTSDVEEHARTLNIGYDGTLIPLYGDFGISVPTVQLTLAAAQRAESLGGWVLLGRNDSSVLRTTAQTLAAIGDGAYLHTPAFFPLLNMAFLAILLLMVIVVLPRASPSFFLASGVLIIFCLVAAQMLLPSITQYWLPLGKMITTLVAVYLLMVLARIYAAKRDALEREMHYWALQSARLYHEGGHYLLAASAIKRVPLNKMTVKWYYRIADALLVNNYPTKALPLWRLMHKKVRNFRDVKQKFSVCQSLLAPLEKPALGPDKTQVMCVSVAIEKLGRYQVRSVLGHGGSGVVYLGHDPVIGRDVALKTLNLNVFSVENQIKVKNRFLAEVKTIGKLTHPNIVAVYDVGQQDNWAFIAMDVARGKPLTEFISGDTLLPIAEVYWIGMKVAEALAFAHAQGIVHCDIKPGNIIYDREAFDVKVTDFGIAKWLDAAHTETGEIMGSPLYMAPEQLQGRPIAEQTDLFSLGATLYQLLTGEPPFGGRTVAEIQQAVLYSRPEAVRVKRAQLPASAARIVNRALKKKTSERFSSASDMAFALNKAIIRDFKIEAKNWRLL